MTAAEETQGRKLDELLRDVVDIRVTLATLVSEMRAANNAATVRDTQHQDHETRLRSLERAKWLIVGAGGVVGGGAGAAFRLLGG